LVCAVLDAFEGYEGLIDRQRHADKIDEFKFWVEIAGILGIEQIQIPAAFNPEAEVSGDFELIASDLREVCDIGLGVSPPVKVSEHSSEQWLDLNEC
jgi:4-hydroxyphenylpyruvate dioxygenase